jgi:putative ABC transport system permease protein
MMGLVAGVAGAFALTRLLGSVLVGVSPTDATTFVAVSAVVAIVALVACLSPALRAMRTDPLAALRNE